MDKTEPSTPTSLSQASPTFSGSSTSVESSGWSGGTNALRYAPSGTRVGASVLLAMYQQPLEDLENAVKAIFVTNPSDLEAGKDQLVNLLRSVRVVMDTLDDIGSAKEVAQVAVAAFRLKAEELSEDPPKQELAEQRHSTYLAAVRDVRANTYKILGDALCIPSSPMYSSTDATSLTPEQLVFERLRTQAELKMLAEESWRKANEVARSSDLRKQRERLLEWDRQMRIKSLNNLAMEDPAAQPSEDSDEYLHATRMEKLTTVTAAAAYLRRKDALSRMTGAVHMSAPNLAAIERSTSPAPEPPVALADATSPRKSTGTMAAPINELAQSFVRARINEYQPEVADKASKSWMSTHGIPKGRSMNDMRADLATATNVNTRFVSPSASGDAAVRSSFVGANMHPGGGREVWVPFQHSMVLYDGHLPIGRCVVCRKRVLPVPKPFRCQHCQQYCHSDCNVPSLLVNIDCQRR